MITTPHHYQYYQPPHHYLITTPPLPHHHPSITSSPPHHYLITTPPLPHHHPSITSSPPLHYLITTPPLPHHHPTITSSPPLPGEPGVLVGQIGNDPLRQYNGYLCKKSTSKAVIHDVFRRGDTAFLSGSVILLYALYLLLLHRTTNELI